MTRNRRIHVRLSALGLLTVLTLAGCSDRTDLAAPRAMKPKAPLRSVAVSDASLALLSVELSGGGLPQSLMYDLPLATAAAQTLSVPAGRGYTATVRAYDRYGALTHQGTLPLELVALGVNRPIALALNPVRDGEDAVKVQMDLVGEQPVKPGYRVVVRPDRKAAYDGDVVTLTATVLDPLGNVVPVNPNEIHWAIGDPSLGNIAPYQSKELATAHYAAVWKYSNIADLIAIWRQNIGNVNLGLIQDPYIDVSAGGGVSCAVKQRGRLYCWGSNVWSMLGTSNDSSCGPSNRCTSAPVLVDAVRKYSRVSVGETHVCALESSTGAPYCWGDNLFSKLGQSSSISNEATPTLVAGTPPALNAISAGWSHTCGTTPQGTAMCWGYNGNSQLGSSTGTTATPTAVAPPSGSSTPLTFTSITAGMMHSCGNTITGQLFCWGHIAGFVSGLPAEITAQGGSSWLGVGLSGTAQDVCVPNAAGNTFCWGDGTYGQLGNGTFGSGNASSVPVQVTNPSGVTFNLTATGQQHSCALSAGGFAYCWGSNAAGQLGDYTGTERNTPVSTYGAHVFTKITVGDGHSCALDNNSDIYCWGANDLGQVGYGDRTPRVQNSYFNGIPYPVKVVAPLP